MPPGETGTVLRYDTEDRSFCLEDTNIVVGQGGAGMSELPEELFKKMSQEEEACTFSVMVSHADAPPPPPPVVHAPPKIRARGLRQFGAVEYDSVDDTAALVTTRARMGRGSATNQNFKGVNLRFNNSPVSFFHFTALLANKEDK